MTPELVTLISLVAFVIGLLLTAGSITFRLVRFVLRGIRRPQLIWRDALVFGGLAVTFLAIGIHTAAGRPWDLEVWWRAATGLLANIAMYLMVYYEFFVIKHDLKGPPEITEHSNGTTSIATHGPSTITVEPDGTEEPR